MAGQPPIFESPEQMTETANEYFTKCEANGVRPGIAKLCYELGFASRQSFYDYEEIPEFSYTIKRLRLWVEGGYEERLQENNPTGAIFALKNMGWRDKVETGITDKDGNDVPVITGMVIK